ncbi:MAG: hypothetical protein FWG20_00480 [Candidatus Cloacimonetes bacterium]|nr:hypothetical protein [Candidatus Cloacimonadota bacterium]
MKKYIMLLLAMTFIFTLAIAQVGITAGVHYVEPNTDMDDDESIKVKIEYDGAFMDDALEIWGNLIYNNPLDSDADGDMEIEVEATYNFNDNMAAILDLCITMPMDSDKDGETWLTPGFRYKFEPSFDFFVRLDLPLILAGDEDTEAMDFVGLNLTMNLNRLRDKRGMADTWGCELKLENWLTEPSEDIFLNYLKITPYFEHEWFYGEIEIAMPLFEDGMDLEGMTITPLIDFNILPVDGLAVEFALPVSNLGADNDDDAIIGFSLGVKYSF